VPYPPSPAGLAHRDSFTTTMLSAGTLAVLYFVTDVFLLAGIAGLWRRAARGTGVGGPRLGSRSSLPASWRPSLGLRRAGTSGYQLGAAIALLGLAAYAVETLLQRSATPWAPILWLLSLAAGIAGAAGFMPQAMTIARASRSARGLWQSARRCCRRREFE